MLTTVAKKVQSRLSRKGVKVVLGDVKTQCELMIADIENPTEVELLAVQEHFMNNATSLTVISDVDNVDNVDSEKMTGDDLAIAPDDQDYPEQSPKTGEITHAPQNTQSQLITTTADQMGIVLDAGEISQIAENINDSSDDFEQDIDAIRSAIIAFVEHKAKINQSKINNLIVEVREVVGRENQRNSRILSEGLNQINNDIQEANQQFKSNVSKALSAFAIPAIKAG